MCTSHSYYTIASSRPRKICSGFENFICLTCKNCQHEWSFSQTTSTSCKSAFVALEALIDVSAPHFPFLWRTYQRSISSCSTLDIPPTVSSLIRDWNRTSYSQGILASWKFMTNMAKRSQTLPLHILSSYKDLISGLESQYQWLDQ